MGTALVCLYLLYLLAILWRKSLTVVSPCAEGKCGSAMVGRMCSLGLVSSAVTVRRRRRAISCFGNAAASSPYELYFVEGGMERSRKCDGFPQSYGLESSKNIQVNAGIARLQSQTMATYAEETNSNATDVFSNECPYSSHIN
ncbi:hypothetical protein IQ07DRAFT_418905 [Pyrenochaeta sp. DS3sAY3a]|nr:hypothetical protein IQ07DRAFT_418905 [Pyrenochaeta sp. DS3sAY3a]